MLSSEAQRAEVTGNYTAFVEALPELLRRHKGLYAVYRQRQFIDVFDSFAAALDYCTNAYSDRLFSIQEVTDEPLSLGWLSDAASDPIVRSNQGPDYRN